MTILFIVLCAAIVIGYSFSGVQLSIAEEELKSHYGAHIEHCDLPSTGKALADIRALGKKP